MDAFADNELLNSLILEKWNRCFATRRRMRSTRQIVFVSVASDLIQSSLHLMALFGAQMLWAAQPGCVVAESIFSYNFEYSL